ncbi:hypothetical protein LRP88_07558 [Fusarium phalaenopsidis]
MTIRQLPQDVVDKIKSSVNITSLNGVACGLLANSLDAGAFKVNISIDYGRDTSKFPSRSSIYGKHGNFLASLATLSLLSITSHHQSRISHNSITIHNSKVLARHLPSPPESRLVSFDHGTRVTVRDLFGSMPVRVKQRASLTERPALDKEWSKLVREVLAMLLAWPSGVHVSIKNTAAQRELRFRPSDKTDIVFKTSRLLMQASLTDSSDVDCWVPISASCGSVSVKGCICTNPVATRRSQFISLGIHPIMNEFGTDVLYEEINRVFSNSSFGVVDGDENKRPEDSPKLEGFSSKELRSRKAIERWPMFYLKITTPDFDDVDGTDRLESQGQTLSAILDLLKATCYGFLKKHHFRPRKVRLSPDDSVFSTSRTLSRSRKSSKRQSASSSSSSRAGSATPVSRDAFGPRADSPFHGWHRVKIGTGTSGSTSSKANDIQSNLPEQTLARPLIGEGGKLLRKPFDEPSPEPEEIPTSKASNTTAAMSALDGDTTTSATRPRKRSKWLQEVIDSWENPVFENVQPAIPSIDDTNLPPAPGLSHSCGRSGHANIIFDAGSMSLSSRISRQALTEATVISQVDRKFILVKLPLKDAAPGKQSSALAVLDQHAVDERCRLEDLMADYFVRDGSIKQVLPVTEPLDRPLIFEVPLKEHSLLDQHRDRFAAWGIVYQTPTPRSPSQPKKVIVTALPPSIMERCRLEPRLLIDLLRTEVWRSVDEGVPLSQPPDSNCNKSWVSRFHGCPRGILEMLHSRACRSAIMFNDVLSVEECEQLISRLSRCVFPFQCAHGRPSMAPLVDLGAGAKFGGWQEREKQAKVRWKNWIEEL